MASDDVQKRGGKPHQCWATAPLTDCAVRSAHPAWPSSREMVNLSARSFAFSSGLRGFEPDPQRRNEPVVFVRIARGVFVFGVDTDPPQAKTREGV